MKPFDTLLNETIKNLVIQKEQSGLPYSYHSLILISRVIDSTQMRTIEEATLKKQSVVVITSMEMKSQVKNDLLQLLTEYEDNSHNPQFLIYKIGRFVSMILIVLGFVALGVYVYFFMTENPIVENMTIGGFFLPLVVAYLGFVMVDFFDRQLLKRMKKRPNLDLSILKPKHFRTREALIVLDDNNGYIESKRILKEFELNDTTMDQIAQLIYLTKNMTDKDKIKTEKNASWLLLD